MSFLHVSACNDLFVIFSDSKKNFGYAFFEYRRMKLPDYLNKEEKWVLIRIQNISRSYHIPSSSM